MYTYAKIYIFIQTYTYLLHIYIYFYISIATLYLLESILPYGHSLYEVSFDKTTSAQSLSLPSVCHEIRITIPNPCKNAVHLLESII